MARAGAGTGRAGARLFIRRGNGARVKDIEVALDGVDILPREPVTGTVAVNYRGGYDGVVIDTQILDSNELVVYRSYAGKDISKNVSRLFVEREHFSGDGRVRFSASVEFEPEKEHDVKFRASIIEQHKEVGSDVLFARLRPA